jgi:hypothetical protein
MFIMLSPEPIPVWVILYPEGPNTLSDIAEAVAISLSFLQF